MHTNRANKQRLALLSRRLWVYLLSLATLNFTHATPIIINREWLHDDDGAKATSTARENLKILPRRLGKSTLSSSCGSHYNQRVIGAIVGGTVLGCFVLFLLCLFCFKIFWSGAHRPRTSSENEQEQRQQNGNFDIYNTPSKRDNGCCDVLALIRGQADNSKPSLNRWGNRGTIDRRRTNSGLEFGDLNATPPLGRTGPIAGPAIPPKAAARLGIEPNVPVSWPPTTPVPSLSFHDRFPSSALNQARPARSRPYKYPISWESAPYSSCSMSTLDESLESRSDTVHAPAPVNYSAFPIVERPLPLVPLPLRTALGANPQSSNSHRKYFLPGQLQTPPSTASTLRIENLDFQRDRYKGTRYSMGDNVI
ncbi:hypothetical protein BGZ63DRAFT_401161 [Mariannaea sp. PMI_226]|nr:hypothetical protein BGZ63DRAFT_401161 [Mariannaea sp. PMI_226]